MRCFCKKGEATLPPLAEALILTHIFFEPLCKRIDIAEAVKHSSMLIGLRGCFTKSVCKMWVRIRAEAQGTHAAGIMENLWAPWRMAFIAPKTPPPPGCIFCTQPAAQRDEDYHILYRGERCFMMLNLYPYNNGHLMVAPYQHVASIEGLDGATLAELMAQAQLALHALRLTMKPDGFNMGINEGKVAGAGFAEHMHFHIVPRWQGDTNFMPVIADIKVMPEHLDAVYQQLKQAIETIKEGS